MNGKYAVCVMAGGQGTRLGHSGPKGTYVVDICTPKTLFQIIVDKILEYNKKNNTSIYLYIMTSQENNDETISFFENNNYLGYEKEHIVFFKQGKLPLLDINGKIVMEEKYKIKEASDGNGGIFEALSTSGALDKLKSDGIKYLFIGNIDNILLDIINPVMLGKMIESNMWIASESIEKETPNEKLGVFYRINGKPSVIEYTEVTDEMLYAKDDSERFLYAQGYMGANIFSIEALEQICKNKLPYHTAIKKLRYIDEIGNEVMPLIPNIYKFEAFIFDSFKQVNDMLIFKVKREQCFAPIKNKEGNDSPETAIELYNAVHDKKNI